MCVPWLFLDAVFFSDAEGLYFLFYKDKYNFSLWKIRKIFNNKMLAFFPSIRPWDPGVMLQDRQDSLAVRKPSCQPPTSGILAEATSIRWGVDMSHCRLSP